MELSQIMMDSINPFFKAADAGMIHCSQFTAGFGAVGLVDALNSFLKAVVTRFAQILSVVEAGTGKGEEWADFQVGLRILGVCCTMSKRLDDYESVLAGWLRDEGVRGEQCLASFDVLRMSTMNSLALSKLKASRILFDESRNSMSTFSTRAQHFCFSEISNRISTILSAIPSLEWKTVKTNSSLPAFSASPSGYITSVGEFLLTLPQQLDLYGDEALWFGIGGLPWFEASDEVYLDDDEYCTHLWYLF